LTLKYFPYIIDINMNKTISKNLIVVVLLAILVNVFGSGLMIF
jgi:hypothetical protein